MDRNNFGSSSGRRAMACAFLRVATFREFQDSGELESVGCKLVAEVTAVLNAELRCRIKNLTAQEHKAGRMLK
eukprot:705573-Pyramimonas_sp.AAC.1